MEALIPSPLAANGMSKKCLMLLAPDLRDAPAVVLLPKGKAWSGALPPEWKGAVVLEVGDEGCRLVETGEELDSLSWTGSAGWHIKLGDAPDAFEQTIMDRTDWGAPEIRVIPSGETRPSLRCRLPMSEDEELVVGRSSRRAHLAIEDEHVSRRHLRFFLQAGKPVVQDLDSRGGTFVNGERITAPAVLHHQDSIRIGNTTLEYYAFLEALDGLPEFGDLAAQARQEDDSSGSAPAGPEAAAPSSPQALDPGRPLWDTVMYGMAILTIVVGIVVALKVLAP